MLEIDWDELREPNLRAHIAEMIYPIGLRHRIDKNTSGLPHRIYMYDAIEAMRLRDVLNTKCNIWEG